MFGQCLAQRRRLLGDIDQAFPNKNLLALLESDGGSDPGVDVGQT